MTSQDTEPPASERPQPLYRVLAWVGITAGVVFIVAVVFGSGFVLAGGHPAWHRGPAAGQAGGCPMMQGGGMSGGMKSPDGMSGPRMMPEKTPGAT